MKLKNAPTTRITFGPLPLYATWDGAASVYMHTTDVETGQPTEVSASVSHGTPRSIRDVAADLLVHELDEHMRVDGEKVTDPHGAPWHSCYTCGRPYAAEEINITLPHVFDVGGQPCGVRHLLRLCGSELTISDERIDASGVAVAGERREIDFVTAVHLLLNATDGEIQAIANRTGGTSSTLFFAAKP